MTSSRQHAQQATEELFTEIEAREFGNAIALLTEAEFVPLGTEIIDRHIAATLAEQATAVEAEINAKLISLGVQLEVFYEEDPAGDNRAVAIMERAVKKLQEQLADMEASFDNRWRADMRAIKMWQEAHPGKENVWPDHADLVVWLMERLDSAPKIK